MSILPRAALGHLRSVAGPLVLLAVVVLLVVGALAGLPRLVDRTSYDDLGVAVGDLPGVARDLAAESSGSIPADPAGAAPLSTLREDLRASARRLAEEELLRGADAVEPGYVVRLPSVEVERASIRRRVEMIALDDPRRVRLVQGRQPRPATLPAAGEIRGAPLVIEAMLSVETARQMRVGVGERLGFLAPQDGGDALVLAPVLEAPFGERAAAVEVVGLFEAVAPDDAAWQHAPSILRPFRFDDGNSPVTVTAAAVVDPALVPGATAGTTVQAWLPLAAAALDLARPEELATGLRRFVAETPTLTPAPTGAPIRLTWSTRTTATVEAALDRAAVTRSVLATVLSGPVGVALVVLGLGVVLLRERQRTTVRVLASRGASRPQIAMLGLAQGLALAAPAVAAGLLAGRLLASAPPGGGTTSGVLAPLLLGAVPVLALPTALLVGLPGRVSRRRPPGPRALRQRRRALRLVGEAVALVVAALCLLALLAGPQEGRVDPLVAAAPVALGVAGALLAWRLVEALLAVLARVARRGPGLVAALGATRARRTPADAVAVLVAVTLATAVAVLAIVVGATLDAAVAQAAREAVREGVPPAVPEGSPSLRGLRTSLAVSVALSVALAALAALLAAAAGRRTRERTLGALDVLGASPTQLRLLALWEAAPAALVGVLAGVGVGGLALLVGALDLAGYAGLDDPVSPARPVALIAGCGLLVLLLVVGVRAAAVALARRADLARLFRDAAPGGS